LGDLRAHEVVRVHNEIFRQQVGRTALATGIAVEIAAGVSLLGENIFGSELKVLFINGEDGGTEIRRRIWALWLARGNEFAGRNLDRLCVAGADDTRVQRLSFLHTTERNASVLDKSGFDALEFALESLRPDLLVLDPLVTFCGGGNMNDNSVMSQVDAGIEARGHKVRLRHFDCSPHQKGCRQKGHRRW
jgi:RecA-family ATPase